MAPSSPHSPQFSTLFLASLVSLGLSGCTGDLLAAEPLVKEGGVALDEGQYFHWSFQVPSTLDVAVEIDLASGPAIDVFLMDQANFDQFRDDHSFRAYDGCSGDVDDRFFGTCTLAPGTYTFVLDHTDAGSTDPPGEPGNQAASVDYHFTIG